MMSSQVANLFASCQAENLRCRPPLSGDVVRLHFHLGDVHQRAGVLLNLLVRCAGAVCVDGVFTFPGTQGDEFSGIFPAPEKLLAYAAWLLDHERGAFLLPKPLCLGASFRRNLNKAPASNQHSSPFSGS